MVEMMVFGSLPPPPVLGPTMDMLLRAVSSSSCVGEGGERKEGADNQIENKSQEPDPMPNKLKFVQAVPRQ